MPCLHVAIVEGVASGTGSSFSRSSNAVEGASSGTGYSFRGSSNVGVRYEHHAIFDRKNDAYIHVSGENGDICVVRTERRAFESRSSSRPRVVKQPATVQEARDILERARAWADDAYAWDYGLFKNNCEHFVNECWNPNETPHSGQARNAVVSIGGAAGAGIGGGIAAAAVPIATTVPYHFLGFIPWGTTTVMTTLPALAVLGIGAGVSLLGGGVAYGIREVVLNETAQTANLVPIAVYNRSGEPITASLWYEDCPMPWSRNAVYHWRACLGIGHMSLNIDSNMAEELNPPTVTDTGDTSFMLKVCSESSNPAGRRRPEVECRVSRGDVVTFNGERLSKGVLTMEDVKRYLACSICGNNRSNIILPCGHYFCEGCILRFMEANDSICPHCHSYFEEWEGMYSELGKLTTEILTCCICFDRCSNVVLEPCGHDNFCEDCILQWRQAGNPTCPYCCIHDTGTRITGICRR